MHAAKEKGVQDSQQQPLELCAKAPQPVLHPLHPCPLPPSPAFLCPWVCA